NVLFSYAFLFVLHGLLLWSRKFGASENCAESRKFCCVFLHACLIMVPRATMGFPTPCADALPLHLSDTHRILRDSCVILAHVPITRDGSQQLGQTTITKPRDRSADARAGRILSYASASK